MTDYTNLRKIVTGDIIIKCRFGKEIRRIPINQVPTYDELCLMMYRVYKTDISTPENIVLKYMDNEGDLISLLDDVDITHAISISSLLKVTVYDKSVETPAVQHFNAPSAQLQASLVEIRDNLGALIKSFETADLKITEKKEENNKTTRRLTAAELADFLNDSSSAINETDKKTSVKELETLSPSANTSKIPYYPPPTPQQQQIPVPQQLQQSAPQLLSQQSQPNLSQQPQQPQNLQQHLQQQHQHQLPQLQQQQQQQQQQPSAQHQYIQTPPASGVAQQQHQQRPVSLQQQQHPSQTSQTNSQPAPYQPNTTQQYNNSANFQPPQLPQSNMNNDLRLQQQQPPRQGYYVPPPPSSMNTPQLPPQPYNAPRW